MRAEEASVIDLIDLYPAQIERVEYRGCVELGNQGISVIFKAGLGAVPPTRINKDDKLYSVGIIQQPVRRFRFIWMWMLRPSFFEVEPS